MLEAEIAKVPKAGEIWALALSADGRFLAATSYDGKINVWELNDEGKTQKIREFETKGSFGMSVDLVRSSTVPPDYTDNM